MFSDSFCQFQLQQKGASADGSNYVKNNPQLLRENFRKKFLYLCKNIWKIHCCKDSCIAYHDGKTCFLTACKYYFILLGEIEELLHKLDIFCFTYQHVDCLYTLFKYQFSRKNIAKSGNVFEKVQRLISFNQKKQRSGQNAEYCKKESLEKKI